MPIQTNERPVLRSWWLGAGYGLLLLVLVLAVMPLPVSVPAGLYSDKVTHALAFAFLMLWFGGLYPRRWHWRLFAVLLVYGVIMELLQTQVPNRYAEGADLVADFIGLSLGWLLAGTVIRRWPFWVERLLGAKG